MNYAIRGISNLCLRFKEKDAGLGVETLMTITQISNFSPDINR